MESTFGTIFAKILIVIFNIIFFCAGIILIVLGSWIVSDTDFYKSLEVTEDIFGSKFLKTSAAILISFGVFTLIFTVLGIIAAVKENRILLGIYIGLLVILCIGLICGGVVAIVFKDKIINSLYKSMNSTLFELEKKTNGSYYNIDKQCSSQNEANFWDFLQYNGGCCGMDGFQHFNDYYNFKFNLKTDCNLTIPHAINNVPWSCCHKKNSNYFKIEHSNVDCSMYSNEGCFEKLLVMVESKAPILIGIGLGFAFFLLFGIIFAVCLCQNPSEAY